MVLATLALLAAGSPLVIAHRGASAERPEHTLAAYELAIRQGADFIEPDLVITRDGVLIARHENELEDSTDVAARPEFASRKTTKTIDGRAVTGWFAEDFTLAEIKTLRTRERWPDMRPISASMDGRFPIATLAEVIDLAKRESRRTGRTIGVYPETKHPSYFRQIGLPLEEPLVRTLHAAGYRGRKAPVFIQSFEVGNLRRLRRMTDLPLVQLMTAEDGPFDAGRDGVPRTYAAMLRPEGLKEIAAYADGIGPAKSLVWPPAADAPTSLVADAHAAGLKVHVWTLRTENRFLPPALKNNPDEEVRRFVKAGVDGFFTDAPALTRRALTP